MIDAGRRLFATAVGLLLSILTVNAVSADGLQHTVSAGDTLSEIAVNYGVSVEIMVEINDIADPNLIVIGDVLQIAEDAGAPAQGGTGHLVQPGDTLSHIAVRYDVSVDELKSANSLESDLIIAGSTLVVPGSNPGEAPSALTAPVVIPPPDVGPIAIPNSRPEDAEIEAMMEGLAAERGIDAGLVKSIAWIESGWDQGARSPSGAVGVMQLMPGTTAWLESTVFEQEFNEELSVYDNLKAGVYFLSYLRDHTGSDELAVAAYYQGLRVTREGTIYNETRRYVDGVMAMKARFWP
jgi:LysM repeat protein